MACRCCTDSDSLLSGNIDFSSEFPVSVSKEEPESSPDQAPVNPLESDKRDGLLVS